MANLMKSVAKPVPQPAEREAASEGEKAVGRLEIVDGGGVRDGIEVLYKAFEFWHHHATNDNVLR